NSPRLLRRTETGDNKPSPQIFYNTHAARERKLFGGATMRAPLFLAFFLFALMSGATQNAGAQTAQPQLDAGVPRELARWRAAQYRDVRYTLDITLAPGADMLKGREKITVTLDASVADLVLDWRVIKTDADPRS